VSAPEEHGKDARVVTSGLAAVWIGLLCAGCLGTVAVGARLRRALTSAAQVRERSDPHALLFRIMQRILQDMQKSAPPPLLPLLRSRLQAEVLTLVLLNPDKEWTLTELASRVGSAVSSVQREVVRAEQAGVMASRRVGRTRLVSAARSPLTPSLTELLLRSFGPRQVLSDELADVPGIEHAYLFGSWASRYSGQEGRPPVDVDVLVIGAPDRDVLDDAAQRAGARLAREVNVTIRSADWWHSSDDGFHTEITRRPLVPITVQEGSP
jgi:predicted nucleotidyltransferase